jgi:hypothetical protein
VFRMFVKTRGVDEGAASEISSIVRNARKFATLYCELDPDDIVGDEFLPLDIAMETVRTSVEKEVTVRTSKLVSLRQRQVSRRVSIYCRRLLCILQGAPLEPPGPLQRGSSCFHYIGLNW